MGWGCHKKLGSPPKAGVVTGALGTPDEIEDATRSLEVRALGTAHAIAEFNTIANRGCHRTSGGIGNAMGSLGRHSPHEAEDITVCRGRGKRFGAPREGFRGKGHRGKMGARGVGGAAGGRVRRRVSGGQWGGRGAAAGRACCRGGWGVRWMVGGAIRGNNAPVQTKIGQTQSIAFGSKLIPFCPCGAFSDHVRFFCVFNVLSVLPCAGNGCSSS